MLRYFNHKRTEKNKLINQIKIKRERTVKSYVNLKLKKI